MSKEFTISVFQAAALRICVPFQLPGISVLGFFPCFFFFFFLLNSSLNSVISLKIS